MIKYEQRRGLMARDWHSFEAAAAPLLNADRPALCHRRLHPARRGHAKDFLAWGYFQSERILRILLILSRRSCCQRSRPRGGRRLCAGYAPRVPRSACICGAGTIRSRRTRSCRSARRSITPPPAAAVCKSPPQAELFVFSDDTAWAREHLDTAGLPGDYSPGAGRGRPCPDAPLPGVCAEQLHLQLVGAVAGRCAGPLCDRAGPLVRQRQKDRPV